MITFQATVTGSGPTALDARLDAEAKANGLTDNRQEVTDVSYSAAYETANDDGDDSEWGCSAFVQLKQTAA